MFGQRDWLFEENPEGAVPDGPSPEASRSGDGVEQPVTVRNEPVPTPTCPACEDGTCEDEAHHTTLPRRGTGTQSDRPVTQADMEAMEGRVRSRVAKSVKRLNRAMKRVPAPEAPPPAPPPTPAKKSHPLAGLGHSLLNSCARKRNPS